MMKLSERQKEGQGGKKVNKRNQGSGRTSRKVEREIQMEWAKRNKWEEKKEHQ